MYSCYQILKIGVYVLTINIYQMFKQCIRKNVNYTDPSKQYIWFYYTFKKKNLFHCIMLPDTHKKSCPIYTERVVVD